MASIIRRVVCDPPTSREVTERVRAAIDNGGRIVLLTLDDGTDDGTVIRMSIRRTTYRDVTTEIIGELTPTGGMISLTVTTHPDLSDSPANATLVCRD